MKITVLMENTTADPALCCEHGLSLYIETADLRILFDMGQTDAFADNAARMGVDLTTVDLAILSHGHYDHGGGMARFLELNEHAPIYVSSHAFEPHYNGADKYIGLDQGLLTDEAVRERLHLVDGGGMEMIPGLELYTCQDRMLSYPLDTAGLKMEQDGRLVPEDFRHEQYLLIRENGHRILFSGCSHRGILNIMEWLCPDVLIGGFHFSKWETSGAGKTALDHAAARLAEYDCLYHTCHCTGLPQYDYLKEQMGDRLQYLAVGQTLELH